MIRLTKWLAFALTGLSCTPSDGRPAGQWASVAAVEGQALPKGTGGIPVSVRAASGEKQDKLGPVVHVTTSQVLFDGEVVAEVVGGEITSGLVDRRVPALQEKLARVRAAAEAPSGERHKGEEGKMGNPGGHREPSDMDWPDLVIVADAELPALTLAYVLASDSVNYGALIAASAGDSLRLYPFVLPHYVNGASTYDSSAVFTVEITPTKLSVAWPGDAPRELGAGNWAALARDAEAFRVRFPEARRSVVGVSNDLTTQDYITVLDVLRGPDCSLEIDKCRFPSVTTTGRPAHGMTLLLSDVHSPRLLTDPTPDWDARPPLNVDELDTHSVFVTAERSAVCPTRATASVRKCGNSIESPDQGTIEREGNLVTVVGESPEDGMWRAVRFQKKGPLPGWIIAGDVASKPKANALGEFELRKDLENAIAAGTLSRRALRTIGEGKLVQWVRTRQVRLGSMHERAFIYLDMEKAGMVAIRLPPVDVDDSYVIHHTCLIEGDCLELAYVCGEEYCDEVSILALTTGESVGPPDDPSGEWKAGTAKMPVFDLVSLADRFGTYPK